MRLPERHEDRAFAHYVNVGALTGVLVARGIASLRELQTFYSYEDALDMAEVLRVTDYNTRLCWEV